MKKYITLIVLVSLFTLGAQAQNDTLYIYEDGAVVYQKAVSEIDSVIFYKPTVAQNETNGTFTDTRDGNTYDWVKIGDQVWMAENLKYLPSVNKVADGSEDAAGSYYYVYDYDGTDVNAAKATSNYATYGVLYNWTAAMANSSSSSTANPSGIQGACPTGWHLPSDAEWTQLTTYVGTSDTGGRLKEIGTTHWTSPNTGATNETGFTALPGGYRLGNGTFGNVGQNGDWWSATELNATYAWLRYISNYLSSVSRSNSSKELGVSVRCVRD